DSLQYLVGRHTMTVAGVSGHHGLATRTKKSAARHGVDAAAPGARGSTIATSTAALSLGTLPAAARLSGEGPAGRDCAAPAAAPRRAATACRARVRGRRRS